MGIYRDAWEDMVHGKTYLLTKIDNPRHGHKFGWYLCTAEGEFLPEFSIPLSDPEIIAAKRAGEHARYLGMRPTKILRTD